MLFRSFESIIDVVSVIKESSMVVTPDTSIVHIATAFQKPTIAIYREDKIGEDNITMWGPNSKKAKIIIAKNSFNPGEKRGIEDFSLEQLRGVEI